MPDEMNPIQRSFEASQAQFGKIKEGLGHLENLRSGLDGLMKLGDLVTQDDVVKAGAALVGKGFGSHEIAALLADMPQGGEALQQWIAMHDFQLRQMEMQAKAVMQQASHQMGVDALHVLMQDHMMGPQPQTGPQSQGMMQQQAGPSGNGLGAGPPALDEGSPVMGSA